MPEIMEPHVGQTSLSEQGLPGTVGEVVAAYGCAYTSAKHPLTLLGMFFQGTYGLSGQPHAPVATGSLGCIDSPVKDGSAYP